MLPACADIGLCEEWNWLEGVWCAESIGRFKECPRGVKWPTEPGDPVEGVKYPSTRVRDSGVYRIACSISRQRKLYIGMW